MEEAAPAKYLTERLRPGDHVLLLYEDPEKMWELVSIYVKYWLPRAKVACVFVTETESVAKKNLEKLQVETSKLEFLNGGELYANAIENYRDTTARINDRFQDKPTAALGDVVSRLFQDGYKEQCFRLEGQWHAIKNNPIKVCLYDARIFVPGRDDESLFHLMRLHDVIVFPGIGLRREPLPPESEPVSKTEVALEGHDSNQNASRTSTRFN